MEDEEYSGVIKRFMYVNRRPPHGTIYAQESLETVLIGAAFDQDVSMIFIDDGVYQLKKQQQPEQVEMKNFSKAYRALEMYDVEKLYVEKESLQARGLEAADLVVDVEILDRVALKDVMEQQDVVISF